MSASRGGPRAGGAAAGRLAELIERAAALRKQGDRKGAVEAYRAATAYPEAPAALFFNLANALFEVGRWQEADSHYATAIERDPQLVEALLQRARCAVRLGRTVAAEGHFERMLRAAPQNFSAWLEAAHLSRQLGQTERALERYGQAIAVAPQRWEGHLAMARALEEAGRRDEAARHYHRALPAASQLQGGVRRVHWHMAKYRLEQGNPAGALEAIRQALLALRIEQPGPDEDERADMQIDLAEILLRLGMHEEAHRACERASAATSEATLARLAEMSFRHNLWQEAQAVLRRAVQLQPDSAAAHWNLAHFSAESWHMQEALAALEKAEALAPQPGAKAMRASIAGRMGDADTALRLYRELAAEEGDQPPRMASSAAMSALYSDRLTAAEVAALHRSLFAPLGRNARAAGSFPNDRDPDRPIRVGLVTADFHRQHPVNIFMQPVLARLDRRRVEIVVYFTGVSYDEQTQIARRRAAGWVECAAWSDAQLAERIAGDRVDILLDLAGHTARHRMSLFGRRAAPVQATFLGYPGSTGVPNIDWIIGDPIVTPLDHEALYSERVLRLPNTVFCYAPDEGAYPFPDYGPAHAARPLTFGSFNNVPKLTPRTIGLWAAILDRLPGARLLLKAPSFSDAGAISAFGERFAAAGVDISRVEFRGPTGLADMMAEYADVDIALDPVPYNGGTTSLQAMWMGVPVVVLRGTQFVSRMGASFMTAAGLPDWVAEDDRQYVEIAVRMAADRPALLALKRDLRRRQLAAPAWDIDRYAADFEAALRRMWQAHCTGHPSAR